MPLPETSRLLEIMAKLRHPDGGCPWDLEQDFASIAPYTIEEAYEVADAVSRKDMDGLKEELGDLLLQVVFHAQMAQEKNLFSFEDVAAAINAKMVRRHPHVFGNEKIETAEAQTANWESIKAEERGKKSTDHVLADVPVALPALLRAQKLQARAARVGFDWPDVKGVLAKIREELAEVEEAIRHSERSEKSRDPSPAAQDDRVKEEIGDLLFAVVNLARFQGGDAETALRQANEKFSRRFGAVEAALKHQGKSWEDTTLDEMESLWQEAKKREAA